MLCNAKTTNKKQRSFKSNAAFNNANPHQHLFYVIPSMAIEIKENFVLFEHNSMKFSIYFLTICEYLSLFYACRYFIEI